MEILQQIFQLCIVPLFGILTAYIVKVIRAYCEELVLKTDSETAGKYVSLLSSTIIDCVLATNQTYVDELKKNNAFDAAAQKIAFEKTYNAVIAILSDEAKMYLAEIYADLDQYITNKIESEVGYNK